MNRRKGPQSFLYLIFITLTLAKDPTKELSLKSVAIELILLTSPSLNNLEEIAGILTNEKSKELTAIVLQKLANQAQEKPYLRYGHYSIIR